MSADERQTSGASLPPPLPPRGPVEGPPPLPPRGPGQAPPPPAASGPPPLPPRQHTPPPIAAPSPPDRALHHVTEQTRTYPCPNCGGQLEFDPATQKLLCPNCGHTQELTDTGDRLVEEQDLNAALQALRERKGARMQQAVAGEKAVTCQNCGGSTTFTGTLTSTRCPYCATPIQREDVHEAPERLAVDGVLPFQVDDDRAREALKGWINSRWFAPNEFKQYNRTGSFASVYTAYFTYDANAATSYRGERGDNYTVTVGSGDNKRTETRTRWRNVSGHVQNSFDDLAVLANEGIDRKHVTALEPWPLEQVHPFSAEYIAGHLCRTYDNDVEECFEHAKERMEDEINATVRRDIGGDKQRIHHKNTRYSDLTFKHLLLPIWLLTVIYMERPFQVVINGVTGEVQGQRPYSKVKIAAAIAAVLAVVLLFFILRAAFG